MYKKSVPFSKIEAGEVLMSFNVLTSIPNCGKDNLLGQTILVKRPCSIFAEGAQNKLNEEQVSGSMFPEVAAGDRLLLFILAD